MVRPAFRVQVLERALALLEALAAGPAGAQELARMTGLPRSTVFRLLGDLANANYATRDPDGRFRLGLKLLELGNAVHDQLRLTGVARTLLEALRDATSLTVTMTIREGTDAICIERLESPLAIRFTIAIGRRTPLHAGAQGRVLLAYAPAEVLDDVLSRPLARLAGGTITDAGVLSTNLALIRERGFAISDAEVNDGARGIAAPVRDRSGQVIAAIAVAGPVHQVRVRDRVVISKVVSAASELSALLP